MHQVRTPRPSPLRRALADFGYMMFWAVGISGWVALIVTVFFQGEW
jgi:hypothetical protein